MTHIPISLISVRTIIRRRSLTTLSVLALLALSARGLEAQTNAQINSGVQFDFPLPGARSLALGGAFVPVADDATAAVANPAGLTALVKPEISVEGRAWHFSSLTPLRGHAFGSATNVGVDNVTGIVEGETSKNAGGLSFLSAVFPKGRFAVGVYRHEQARYRADIQSEGPFVTDPQQFGGQDRIDPFTASMSLDIVNYGVAVGYRFSSGLAIGGGLAIADFSIDSTTNGFSAIPQIQQIQPVSNRPQFTAPGQVYGPANFAETNRVSRVTELGDDVGIGFNFGALYRPPSSSWTVGGAVRINPEFKYDAEARWGPRAADFNLPVNGVIDQDVVPYKLPDTYSVGVSFRPTDHILFTTQYDRVQFSQLSRDIHNVFGPDTGSVVDNEIKNGLHFPDSNQVRAGAEYSLVKPGRVIALRLGTAFESDHRMFYSQVGTQSLPRLQALYLPGDDQWHVMPGVGFGLDTFQIDGAFDISERTRTLSVSAVYRF